VKIYVEVPDLKLSFRAECEDYRELLEFAARALLILRDKYEAALEALEREKRRIQGEI